MTDRIEQEAWVSARALSDEFFQELSVEQIYEAGYIAGASRAAAQEPTEAEVRTVAEAICEEMPADGDFDPTYDYTDDAMRYARAALAVPGETGGGRA